MKPGRYIYFADNLNLPGFEGEDSSLWVTPKKLYRCYYIPDTTDEYWVRGEEGGTLVFYAFELAQHPICLIQIPKPRK